MQNLTRTTNNVHTSIHPKYIYVSDMSAHITNKSLQLPELRRFTRNVRLNFIRLVSRYLVRIEMRDAGLLPPLVATTGGGFAPAGSGGGSAVLQPLDGRNAVTSVVSSASNSSPQLAVSSAAASDALDVPEQPDVVRFLMCAACLMLSTTRCPNGRPPAVNS